MSRLVVTPDLKHQVRVVTATDLTLNLLTTVVLVSLSKAELLHSLLGAYATAREVLI